MLAWPTVTHYCTQQLSGRIFLEYCSCQTCNKGVQAFVMARWQRSLELLSTIYLKCGMKQQITIKQITHSKSTPCSYHILTHAELIKSTSSASANEVLQQTDTISGTAVFLKKKTDFVLMKQLAVCC